jgi:hypothetical protein
VTPVACSTMPTCDGPSLSGVSGISSTANGQQGQALDAAAVSLLYSKRAVQVLGRQAKVSMDAVVLAN